MPWVAPAIAAVASIAGSSIAAASAKRQQDRQNAANLRLQNLANQQNVELWNMQNEYNTPKAQMERYRDAGLNPYLAQSNPGLAGTPPTMQPAKQSYVSYLDKLSNVGQVVQMVQNLRASEAQIRNLNAMEALNKARKDEVVEKTQDWRFKNLFGYGNYDTKNKILNLQMSNLYNKYMLDWNVDQPFIDYLGDDINNVVRVPKKKELLTGLYNKQAQSSLSYQNAGTSLRNLQYKWQADQNAFGLGTNVPWFASFARKAIQYTEEKRKDWLRYH